MSCVASVFALALKKLYVDVLCGLALVQMQVPVLVALST